MGLTPSFRYPGTIPKGVVHPAVETALNNATRGLVDVNQAIVALKSQVSANTTATTATTTSPGTSTTTATENVTNVTVAGGPVNNQTGVASYTTAQGDNGALVLLSSTSAIAVTLNNAVTIPYSCSLSNHGMTVATVTPQQGTVNNGPSLMLAGGGWVTVYFDGMNWWAESPGDMAGSVTQLVAGTGVAISPTSGVGVVTVSASGGSGGVTQIVAGSNVTIAPSGGTGVVTINATGGGSVLTTSVNFSVAAGSGAQTISVAFTLAGTANTTAFVVSLQTPVQASSGGTTVGVTALPNSYVDYLVGLKLIVVLPAPPIGTYNAGTYIMNVKALL